MTQQGAFKNLQCNIANELVKTEIKNVQRSLNKQSK